MIPVTVLSHMSQSWLHNNTEKVVEGSEINCYNLKTLRLVEKKNLV